MFNLFFRVFLCLGLILNKCIASNNIADEILIKERRTLSLFKRSSGDVDTVGSPLIISDNNVELIYNETNALRNLYFAYGAYCSAKSIKSWTCKWCNYIPGFKIETVIDLDYLQSYVGFDTEENQIVVSFRGTHNVEDWIDDLDVIKTAYPGVSGGEVHKGFYESWIKYLSPSIMTAVENLIDENPGVDILINGHSLGGALAQLAALSIYNYLNTTNSSAKITCYTFGSPRWGNHVMANYFNDRIYVHWRITNLKDVVPTVPPRDFGYYHTYINIWYKSDSPLKYKECNEKNGEDSKCEYIGYSIENHLHYFGIYEDCE